MTFRYFLQIHLLFGALLFSCSVFSNPVLHQQEGASLPPGSQISWSDTDVGSEYWVYVGTSPGANNLLDSGNISNQMSVAVNLANSSMDLDAIRNTGQPELMNMTSISELESMEKLNPT